MSSKATKKTTNTEATVEMNEVYAKSERCEQALRAHFLGACDRMSRIKKAMRHFDAFQVAFNEEVPFVQATLAESGQLLRQMSALTSQWAVKANTQAVLDGAYDEEDDGSRH